MPSGAVDAATHGLGPSPSRPRCCLPERTSMQSARRISGRKPPPLRSGKRRSRRTAKEASTPGSPRPVRPQRLDLPAQCAGKSWTILASAQTRRRTRRAKTVWCGREDSNFHGLSATATSRLRVYQFRHDRTSRWSRLARPGPGKAAAPSSARAASQPSICRPQRAPVAKLTATRWEFSGTSTAAPSNCALCPGARLATGRVIVHA